MLELLTQIQSGYGLIVLVLVILLAFAWFLLWKTTWSVWSKAMEAKDKEIQRISQERDAYQALIFARLESSSADTLRVRKNKDQAGK